MDKFVLAENPMSKSDDIFIIHLLQPVCIMQVHKGHVNVPGKTSQKYSFENTERIVEEWTISSQFYFTNNFISEPDPVTSKIMDKAWRWFRSIREINENNAS